MPTDICGVSMGNERIYATNTEEEPRIYVSWGVRNKRKYIINTEECEQI